MLSDAYRECYAAENMADKTVWAEACRLASNHKVTARVKAIQAEIEKPTSARAGLGEKSTS